MRPNHKLPAAILAVLLLATLLAACGQSIGVIEERFEQGNQYIQTGQGYLAANDLEKATAEFKKAITEFEAVLAEDPEHISALTNLGVAYYNIGELDKAIAEYQKALELAPNDSDIHSNLAAAYVQKQDFEQALAEYQRAVELNPELSQAYFGLGVINLALGKNDEARTAFENFIKYDDGKDAIATQQAQQYLEQLK